MAPQERESTHVTTSSSNFQPKLWVGGDWNAFFGLFTNVVLNVLVLAGLSLGVVQIPADTVFGRILPALGIALPIGNLFYAWLAWKLAKREGRSDVAAMPYGPSVPHMFIVVFVIMLPVYLKTGMRSSLGSRPRVGPVHRPDRHPRRVHRAHDPAVHAARRHARHLGRHLHRVHLDAGRLLDVRGPLDRVHQPGDHPGVVDAQRYCRWGSRAASPQWSSGRRWAGYRHRSCSTHRPGWRRKLSASLSLVGIHVPIPGIEVFTGLGDWLTLILATAIPLGVYNFIEGINNVECGGKR